MREWFYERMGNTGCEVIQPVRADGSGDRRDVLGSETGGCGEEEEWRRSGDRLRTSDVHAG